MGGGTWPECDGPGGAARCVVRGQGAREPQRILPRLLAEQGGNGARLGGIHGPPKIGLALHLDQLGVGARRLAGFQGGQLAGR